MTLLPPLKNIRFCVMYCPVDTTNTRDATLLMSLTSKKSHNAQACARVSPVSVNVFASGSELEENTVVLIRELS